MTAALDTERATWLAERRTGIGASEVAAVLGCHPYMSAYTLWHLKRGLIEEPEESEVMEWGKLLEPVIAEKYARATGRQLVDHGRHAARRSERWPFLLATLDREIAPIDDRGPGCLEIKTTGTWVEPKWKDEPPLHVQAQLQAQLAVTGFRWGSIAVLVGGQKYEHADFERNDDFIALLVERCAAFWALVESGEPPEVDGSESTGETLRRLYPQESGEVVELPPEADPWSVAYLEASEAEKRAKALKDEAKNHLLAAMGAASMGMTPGGFVWTLKTTERAGYSVAPTTYRALRRKKAKAA